MTIQEIEDAVDAGKKVYWATTAYIVIKDSLNRYMIQCLLNNSYVMLTDSEGNLSEDAGGFFMLE